MSGCRRTFLRSEMKASLSRMAGPICLVFIATGALLARILARRGPERELYRSCIVCIDEPRQIRTTFRLDRHFEAAGFQRLGPRLH